MSTLARAVPIDAVTLWAPARRVNAKRDLLIVSRVQGKHIPVHGSIALAAGAALALRCAAANGVEDERETQIPAAMRDPGAAQALYADLTEHPITLPAAPLVIGFAETATALGHAVAACIAGSSCVHTTRRALPSTPLLEFAEVHSHAPQHLLHVLPRPGRPLLLVDDEVTTARTALTLLWAASLHGSPSRCDILALTDWTDADARGNIETIGSALQIPIAISAVRRDDRHAVAVPETDQPPSAPLPAGTAPATPPHRRLRVASPVPVNACAPTTAEWRRALDTVVESAVSVVGDGGVPDLVLGTGEFMHVPQRVAAALGTHTSATTRSPIAVADRDGYPVRSGVAFAALDGSERIEFAYNIPSDADIVVCVEGEHSDAQLRALLTALPSPRRLRVLEFVRR